MNLTVSARTVSPPTFSARTVAYRYAQLA
jgi:hypothetical protein